MDDTPDIFTGKPEERALYEAFLDRAAAELPEFTVSSQKTQMTFRNPRVFACVSLMRPLAKRLLPEHYIVVTLGLARPLDPPRAARTVEPYPGRWTNHIVVGSADEVDDELVALTREAYDFARSK